jgi:murein DD-endopeptidase MepM/ murein hydrolase activator NlpD
MKLYPPLYKTGSGIPRDLNSLISLLSQRFGENPDMYKPFGLKGHNGLDWPCPEGTELYASHDGRVTQVSTDEKAGMGVVIEGVDGKTIYWHMSKVIAPKGILVQRGDLIGLSGNTGFSTGPHLHFGYKPLPIDRSNGYDGAVDPKPLLVWDVLPSNSIRMTKEEVRNLYRLAFYREPDAGELTYWEGKPLGEFLKAAIVDRAAFLQKP